jgi:hypothetical protein
MKLVVETEVLTMLRVSPGQRAMPNKINEKYAQQTASQSILISAD